MATILGALALVAQQIDAPGTPRGSNPVSHVPDITIVTMTGQFNDAIPDQFGWQLTIRKDQCLDRCIDRIARPFGGRRRAGRCPVKSGRVGLCL